MDLPSPIEKFGRYHLLHRIAVGGMAEIFLAYSTGDNNQGQLLVVKRIREDLSQDTEFVNMFLDEGRVIQSLAHPNIVRMIDCGVIDDRSYIGLEFVWGESLSNLMVLAEHQRIQFPAGAALYIGGEVARALHYAHHYRGAGGVLAPVIHRDVTLGNVIVSYEGMVKVLDFGIAKTQDRLVHTQAGSVKGTLIYLAPEQVLEQEVGPYTDIYQLGVLLYKTLVGREPIEAETEAGVVSGIVQSRIIKPSSVIPGFPASVEALLLKAMARKPEKRFSTAGELRGAILDLLGEHYAVGKQGLVNLVSRITDDRFARQQNYVNDLLQGIEQQDEQSDLLRWAAGAKEPKTLNVELSVVEKVDLSEILEEEAEPDPTMVTGRVEAPGDAISPPGSKPGFKPESTMTGTQNRDRPLPQRLSLQERYAEGVLSPELTETGMVITREELLDGGGDEDEEEADESFDDQTENEFTASGVFSSVRTLVTAPPTRVTAAQLSDGPTQISEMAFPDVKTLLSAEPAPTVEQRAVRPGRTRDAGGAREREEVTLAAAAIDHEDVTQTVAAIDHEDVTQTVAAIDHEDVTQTAAVLEEEEEEDDALPGEDELADRTMVDAMPVRRETGELDRSALSPLAPNDQPTLVVERLDPAQARPQPRRPARFAPEGPTRVDDEDDPFDDLTVEDRGLMGAKTLVPTVSAPSQQRSDPDADLDFDIDIDVDISD